MIRARKFIIVIRVTHLNKTGDVRQLCHLLTIVLFFNKVEFNYQNIKWNIGYLNKNI